MEMGPDGAFSITGNWLNKVTGDVVQVMNSIIDDDKMIILTNKGQIDMNDFSRDYVQMSSEMYDEHTHTKLSKEKEEEFEKHNRKVLEKKQEIEFNQDFPEELLKKIEEEENGEKYSEIKVETHKKVEHKPQTKTKKLPKEELIRPIFDKIELNPKINFSIDCDTFPTAQFNMLQEFFDVTEEDIANYIIHYIIADEDFVGAVESFVKEKLSK